MNSIFQNKGLSGDFKPFGYPEVYEFVRGIRNTYWTHEKFTFTGDIHDFKTKLTESDRTIIGRILRTFAETEIHVADDFWSLISKFLPSTEFCLLSHCFAENEDRHADAYWQLNEVLNIRGFEPYSKDPVLASKFENLLKNSLDFDFDAENLEHIRRFAFGLVVFSAFTERVALFGQFMILKSFSRNGRNFLKDLSNIVDYSKQDESTHGDAGIWIFNKLKEEYPQIWTREFKHQTYNAFSDALNIEVKVIEDIFRDNDLPNLTKEQVINYMKHLANTSLNKIGLKSIFIINEDMIKECEWFELDSQAMQHTDFLGTGKSTSYTKDLVAFNSDNVKVPLNFHEKLQQQYVTNER
jgi:ribonucleoside-diphosphate reductase beta chain